MAMQTLQVQTEAHGAVSGLATAVAVRKVRLLLRIAPGPVLFARVKLTMAADPAVLWPTIAQVSLDLNGRLIRAQATGSDLHEAVNRMTGRLRIQLERTARNWAAGEPARAAAQARTASRALAQAGDERAASWRRSSPPWPLSRTGNCRTSGMSSAQLADWARGPGSLSHAIGIGRMFARTRRRWGTTVPRCELALASSSVAEALWAALGRTIARSQARADQAEALRTLGARHAAIVMIESAIDIATPPLTGEVVLDIGWFRPMLLADLHNLASKAMDTGAMDRALRRLDALAAALHDPANRATPEQSALADQLLGLVADLDQQVIGMLYRAQEARDAGDTAGAARLFAAAEAVPRTAAAGDGLPLLAIVRSFELRLAEAAALFREWLAGRLTILDTLRPQATMARKRPAREDPERV